MLPNARNTAPDQRFFHPFNGETEYHPSFDTAGKPSVEILPGTVGYVLATNSHGELAVHKADDSERIYSGSRVHEIVMTRDHRKQFGDYPDAKLTRDGRQVVNATRSYVVQPKDTLIINFDPTMGRHSDGIRDLVTRVSRNHITVPASEPLPFITGKLRGTDDEKIKFGLAGVITAAGKLISWGSRDDAVGFRDYVDDCVVNRDAQNSFEVALLSNKLGGNSLVGLVALQGVVANYLDHFDRTHRTRYVPSIDPIQRLNSLPPLTEEQRQRYDALSRMQSSPRPR